MISMGLVASYSMDEYQSRTTMDLSKIESNIPNNFGRVTFTFQIKKIDELTQVVIKYKNYDANFRKLHKFHPK